MPRLVVVDGSNIATEGRAMPSLMQLNDAVLAFRAEFPDDLITVVVDATFGHRIDPREVPEFDAAVEHNELVTPPAGAIGRGDAFVLSIANKANATILSNDSFQEFHAHYDWLFDEGRLIGGKPVPHVGWVFVARSPVRGPVSRRAVRDAKKPRKAHTTTVLPPPVPASGPPPTPKVPPPGRARRGAASDRARAEAATADAAPAKPPAKASGRDRGKTSRTPSAVPDAAPATGERQQMVNDLLPFLAFVENHPVGTQVQVVTESYSSHGAYVTIGDVRGYVPLRLMGDPPPRSAREVLKLGEAVTTVVASFNPGRRSIDLALPGGPVPAAAAPVTEAKPPRRRRGRAVAEPGAPEAAVPTPEPAAPAPVPAKAPRARTKAAPDREAVPEVAAAPVAEPAGEVPTPARRSRKKAAAPSPAPEPAATKAAAPKAGATKAAATKAAASKAGATKAGATKAGATKAGATKAGATKRAAAKRGATRAATEPVAPAPAKRSRTKAAEPAPEPAPAPPKRSRSKAAAPAEVSAPAPEQVVAPAAAAKPAKKKAAPRKAASAG